MQSDVGCNVRTGAVEHTLILVGKAASCRHCVCDNHGLMVDSFITHEEAVCFAFAEQARHPGAIVMNTPAGIGC